MEEGAIVEGGDYMGDPKTFGFKEIVLSQLQRVVTNSSKEMRAGFWIMTNNPNMASQKVRYVGDSRKELVQSLETLHDLLMPKFDEKMKKQSENIDEKLKEAREKQIEKEQMSTTWERLRPIYRELFQELCLFLDRKGWLAAREISD